MAEEIDIPTGDTGASGADPLALFGSSLQRRVANLCQLRLEIEREWVEDFRQYKGMYSPEMLAAMPEGGSRIFVNITKPKTKNGTAQLIDMLFPSDDKNYGIRPTPDPDLAEASQGKEPVVYANGDKLRFKDNEDPVTTGDLAKMEMEQAAECAKKMETAIEDQLVECQYNAASRDAIEYAGILGTGVLCGPEVELREKSVWVKDPASGQMRAAFTADKRPRVRHVPLWDFFPDLAAKNIQECNEIFERSYMSKKTLKTLRRRQGIIEPALNRLLNEISPKSTQNFSEHVSTLRELSGIISMVDDQRYEVWTYRGPIEKSVLVAAGLIKPEKAEEAENEYDGIVIFCGGEVLKAAINPMETEDWPYSVFCWDKDPNCIFGTGIPRAARHSQAVINTAWRLMLDNATKSAGPQVVFDSRVESMDGGNKIVPWGRWRKTDPNLKVQDAFGVFAFPSLQTEIANIYTLAKGQLDEETGLPAIQQGEQGQVTPTVGGMSMLMNAASSERRHQVKNWDDDVTVPMITRFYNWNMQFNKDESIKGDLQVHARGTSALLMKEQQAQTLIALIDKYAGHPILSTFLKSGGLDALRKAVQAMHINPDDILKTDEQLASEQEQARKQAEEGGQQQEDPRITAEKLRAENRIRELEIEAGIRGQENNLQLEIAQMKLQHAMLEVASRENMTLAQLEAKLQEAGWNLDLKKSMFQAELQVKQAEGMTANFGLDGK
jgi:hypothetical protein